MSRSTFRIGTFKSNVDANGTKDGVNDTFTIPDDKYLASTLMVHLNGNLYRPESIQTNPDQVTFQIVNDTLPIATDSLTCSFVTSR